MPPSSDQLSPTPSPEETTILTSNPGRDASLANLMHSSIYYININRVTTKFPNLLAISVSFGNPGPIPCKDGFLSFKVPSRVGEEGAHVLSKPHPRISGPVIVLVPTLHLGNPMGILPHHLAQEMTGLCLPLVHYRTERRRM